MDEEDEPLSGKDLVIIPEYIKKILISIAKKELKDDATVFSLFIEKIYDNEIIGLESYIKLTKHLDTDEMKKLYMKGYYNSSFVRFIDNNKINEIKYAIENDYVNIKGYGEDNYIRGIYSTIFSPDKKEIFLYLINNASLDYILEKGILEFIAEYNRTELYKILDKKYDIFKNIHKNEWEEFLMMLYSKHEIINNINDSLLKYLVDSKKISLDYYIDYLVQHLSTYLLINSAIRHQNVIIEYIIQNTKIYLDELMYSEEYTYSHNLIKTMILDYKDDILNSVKDDREVYNNYKEIIEKIKK